MMKRLLTMLKWTVGILAFLAISAALFFYLKGIPHYTFQPTAEINALQVRPDSIRIARGAKIATLLCNECHKDPTTGKLTGRPMPDIPAELGKAASLNITRDSVHGIGAWTDGELYYFLRTGIRKDGSWAPPFMPKFPLMADEDLYSIIAWLRSDDPLVASAPQEYPPNQYNLLVKFLANVAIFPPPLPNKTILVPDTSSQLELGRYVADALCACYGCHSADFTKQDPLNPEKSLGYYGGGNPMLNMDGKVVATANITMDKETGIGNWTREQFREAVKYGKNPKGGPLHYPMFPHTTLTDAEVDAVWVFLQTVPPVRNQVNRFKE